MVLYWLYFRGCRYFHLQSDIANLQNATEIPEETITSHSNFTSIGLLNSYASPIMDKSSSDISFTVQTDYLSAGHQRGRWRQLLKTLAVAQGIIPTKGKKILMSVALHR
jgi:hypothetical protein